MASKKGNYLIPSLRTALIGLLVIGWFILYPGKIKLVLSRRSLFPREVQSTDYSALILVLLDSTCRPVSNFILSGGECGDDPKECDLKRSILNGRQIKSFVRSIVDRDNLYESDSILIDSINYITEILPNGTFKSRQKDSIRYYRHSFIE